MHGIPYYTTVRGGPDGEALEALSREARTNR